MAQLEQELKALLNKHTAENSANTPDFILSQYLIECMNAFSHATQARDSWFGFRTMQGNASQGSGTAELPRIYGAGS